jgi:drug/metabolite transporter (DMT)-like permease
MTPKYDSATSKLPQQQELSSLSVAAPALQHIGWASGLLAVAMAALWGGNVVALKLGLATFPPFWSAFWRMVIGLAVVGLWAQLRGVPLKPQPGEARLLLMLGLLFTVQISAMNLGVNWTSPAYGVVLMNTYPLVANLIGHFFVVEDRLSWPRVFGLALAFGGICIIFLGHPEADLAPRPLLGNLVVTLSGFLLGTRTVYTQRLVQAIDPIRPVFWQMVVSLPFFSLAGWLWEAPTLQAVGPQALLAVAYQGVVVAGLCFIAWTMLLKKHSPGSLSMFAFPTPIFGVLASGLFYGEDLGGRLWAGLAAVMAGIFIATRLGASGRALPVDTEAAAR